MRGCEVEIGEFPVSIWCQPVHIGSFEVVLVRFVLSGH